MSAVAFGDGPEAGPALRWTAAALVVVGLHAGALWWLAGRAFQAPPPPEGAAGVTIDLEPVAVPVPPTAYPKPMADAGPDPTPQVAEAPDASTEPPPPQTAAEPPPPEAAVAPPPPAPAEPPAVEAAAAPPAAASPAGPSPIVPPPAEAAKPDPLPPPPVPEVVPPAVAAASEAVLPPRPAPPRPVKKVSPPKPDPREIAREEAREAREEARRRERTEAAVAAQEERAEAAAAAREARRAARAQERAARAAATREGGGEDRESAAPRASGADVANWRGEVVAHLNAYKPSSPDGAAGTVRVAFSVDRGGRVVSASVSGSSGDAGLDQAALAMVRRSSPVPAPPPEMGGRINLAVPVHFD